MKSLIIIIITILFVLVINDVYSQNKMTLQQSVETGIANNLQVQQSSFQMEREEIT